MLGARHELEDHTSEVKLKLHAPTLPALFAEAALALAEVLAERPPHVSRADEQIVVRARDLELLLAEWLDELVYRVETSGLVYTAVEIERLSETELRARIGGAPVSALKTPVKAATLHGLRVAPEGEDGWTASVVLDV